MKRTGGFTRNRIFLTLAASLPVLLICTVGNATVLTTEPFTYGNSVNLSGQNGGTGWNGGWTVGNPGTGSYANETRNNGNNFAYPNYNGSTSPPASGGDHLNLAAGFGTPNFNYAQRYVDVAGVYTTAGLTKLNTAVTPIQVVGADNTTLWGSFLYRAGNTSTQFWIRNEGVGQAEFTLPSNSSSAGGLMLFRIDYLAGNDNISFWSSPNLATWTPSSPATSTASGDYAFNLFILVENGANIEAQFDDIRFGTQAVDVVPVPEPSSLALLVMGIAGVVKHICRKK